MQYIKIIHSHTVSYINLHDSFSTYIADFNICFIGTRINFVKLYPVKRLLGDHTYYGDISAYQ